MGPNWVILGPNETIAGIFSDQIQNVLAHRSEKKYHLGLICPRVGSNLSTLSYTLIYLQIAIKAAMTATPQRTKKTVTPGTNHFLRGSDLYLSLLLTLISSLEPLPGYVHRENIIN